MDATQKKQTRHLLSACTPLWHTSLFLFSPLVCWALSAYHYQPKQSTVHGAAHVCVNSACVFVFVCVVRNVLETNKGEQK
jgi:hypothetical protein